MLFPLSIEPLPAAIAYTAVLLTATLVRVAPAQATAPEASTTAPKRVAVVIYDGVELLDFAGPYEVFKVAQSFGGPAGPAFDVVTIAPAAAPIDSMGVDVIPDHTFADGPPPDIIVVPGGSSRRLADDAGFRAWFSRHVAREALVLTVCTGVRAAAQEGLLRGRSATTFWRALDRYQSSFPDVAWRRGVRFVDNGNVITSAGISAGIDGSLHLVARLLGVEAARATARGMQYDWRPTPEDQARYPRLHPALDETARMRQLVAIGRGLASTPMVVEAVDRLDALGAASPDDLAALGYVLLVERDLGPAEAAYLRALDAGVEDAARAWYNVACARSLAGRTDDAIDALAAAIDAGWTNLAHLRADSDLEALRDEPRLVELCRRIEGGDSGR